MLDDYKAVASIFTFENCPSPVLVVASPVLLLHSVQLADSWGGVERRCVVAEVCVVRHHVRFEAPFSQVDRDDLLIGIRCPVSLNRIDLETLSQEF